MKNLTILFDKILSILFPLKLPTFAQYAEEIACFDEQGSCGLAVPRPYKDAIDRMQKSGMMQE